VGDTWGTSLKRSLWLDCYTATVEWVEVRCRNRPTDEDWAATVRTSAPGPGPIRDRSRVRMGRRAPDFQRAHTLIDAEPSQETPSSTGRVVQVRLESDRDVLAAVWPAVPVEGEFDDAAVAGVPVPVGSSAAEDGI
jgi:hypothetical protein